MTTDDGNVEHVKTKIDTGSIEQTTLFQFKFSVNFPKVSARSCYFLGLVKSDV